MRIFGISSVVLLFALASFGAMQFEPSQVLDPAGVAGEAASSGVAPGVAAAHDPAPSPTQIRAMTYNIFMRPPPVSWPDRNMCRAHAIAQQLGEGQPLRDILVLNESFERESVGKLADLLHKRYPYQILRQPEADGLRVNGGVSVLSRYPIEKWSSTAYERCAGKWNDCMAHKGFVWARIRISADLKVNVLATHLNSGGSEKAREVRRSQIAQIRDFMRTNPSVARWPTLLMGDLNINGLRWELRHPDQDTPTEYAEAMELLGNSCQTCEDEACLANCGAYPVDVFRAKHGPWQFDSSETLAANTYNCVGESMLPCISPNSAEQWNARMRIDYILNFGAPALAPALALRLVDVETQPFLDDTCDTTYLSDHRAVEAKFAIGESSLADFEDDADAPEELHAERQKSDRPIAERSRDHVSD